MSDRVCVAVVEDDRVLMVRQTYQGETFWTFPGGQIEPGERAEDAAVREAFEETGLRVQIDRCLYQGRRQRGNRDGIYSCYAGIVIGGSLLLGADTAPDGRPELHDVAWLPLADVRDHPEVLRALLHAPEADYDLTPPVVIHDSLPQGASNETLMIDTGVGRLVLKRYHPLHVPASIDYEHQILDWATRAGLSFGAPAPLSTRSGEWRTWHDGAWRSLMPYFDGERCDMQRLEHIALLGSAVGELHQSLQSYPMTPRPGKNLNTELFDFPPFDPLVLTPELLGVPATREHDQVCGWFREQAVDLRAFTVGAYRALPVQVCHNDLSPYNIIVADGCVVAVLDWEFAGPAARALDLAMALRMTIRPWEHGDQWKQVRTFFGSYNQFTRLEPNEIAALPLLLRLRTITPGLWWMGRDGAAVLRSIGYLQTMTNWLDQHGERLIAVIADAQTA